MNTVSPVGTTSSPEDSDFDPVRGRLHQQLLSSIAHDLKSPLAAIIGSLEVYERMKNKLSQERQEALIHIALHESYRLDALITNVVDMMRLEEGAIEAQPEPLDVETAIKKILLHLGPQLKECTVHLDESAKAVRVVTDQILLTKVMGLVLDNAMKFGGTPPVIHIAYGEKADQAFISLHDNGEGVPEDQQVAIFSKYTRFLKPSRTIFGTGLGLTICREMMHVLRGQITVANHPGGGAVFTLFLPMP